ncbi:MAG: hypothetical protein ACTSSJ_03805 [Candidatus Odinarchaeia archaeon]
MKSIKVSHIHVYVLGNAAKEIEDFNGEISKDLPQKIVKASTNIKKRLLEVSRITAILLKNGWSGYGEGESLNFYKPIPAKKALQELGELKLEWVNLEEVEYVDL